MSLLKVITASLLLAAAASHAAEEEFTNFRVGVGGYAADLSNAPQYMPDSDQPGFAVFAEFRGWIPDPQLR